MKEESVTLNGQTSGIVCPEWAEREELLTAWAEQLRGQARRESEGIEELTPQMLRVYAAAIGLGVPRIARQAEAADAKAVGKLPVLEGMAAAATEDFTNFSMICTQRPS